MHKHQKTFFWTFVASESIHVFCCVLPALFSVISLLVGVGFLSSMPAFMEEGHHLIHAYEVPIMVTSALVIMAGWGFYAYSRRLDCSKTVCAHEPCAPKKNRSHLFLMAASALFSVNLVVYFTLHA